MRASLVPFASVALVCAGCQATPDGGAALYGETAPSQLAQTASPQQAIAALPPEAGAAIAVVERRSQGVIAQNIAYRAESAASGEDFLKVAIGPRGAGDAVLAPRIVNPTHEEIGAELSAVFPGFAMSPADAGLMQNRYGPFGYASGRGAGRMCYYAWQFVSGSEAGAGFLLGTPESQRAAAVRLRLCRKNMTPETFVSVMQGLDLSSVPRTSGTAQPRASVAGGDALDSALSSY